MKQKILIGFAILWVALVGYKLFNPAASDGRRFFQHLSTEKILHVDLNPIGGNSPIMRHVRIDDHAELDRFVSVWEGVRTFIPNHPKDIWSISVSIQTYRGVYAGVLRATSNQGVMFDFNKSPTGWPVNSEFQLAKPLSQIEGALRSINGWSN